MRRHKLVRDNSAQTANGPIVLRPVSDDVEFGLLLGLKLHEEVAEVMDDPTDPAEYADVLEVLLTMAALHGVSWVHVLDRQIMKRADRGGFTDRLVMTGRSTKE